MAQQSITIIFEVFFIKTGANECFLLFLFRILFLFYKSFCVSWSKYINEEEDKIWFNDEVNRGLEIGIDFSRVFFQIPIKGRTYG